MSESGARGAIVLCAFVTGGVYAWRWLAEGETPSESLSAGSVAGNTKPLVSPEGFLVAWGLMCLGLSLISSAWPGFAGGLAVLIIVTDLLANGVAVAKGTTKLREKKEKETAKTAAQKTSETKLNEAAAREKAAAKSGPTTKIVKNERGGPIEVRVTPLKG